MTNIEEATNRFRKKLESGYYSNIRSTNKEKDYSETKEQRDTKAIEEMAESTLFQTMFSRS